MNESQGPRMVMFQNTSPQGWVPLTLAADSGAPVWWCSLPCEQPLGLCCRRVDLSVVPEVAVSEPSAGQTTGAERSGVFRCRVSEFRLLAPLPEQRPRLRVGG
ncbi:hypothetical protein B0T13DRAFT_243441 [Neurospora crassa]|nr:hypothetical protein B0T13DRAFT_243441 [Neurospora crassa]